MKKVLIGFIASAYLCWFMVVVYYVIEYNPAQGGISSHINPIDRGILGWIRKHTGLCPRKYGTRLEEVRNSYTAACHALSRHLILTTAQCVLTLGDQQIGTGVAILGSGFSQLNPGLSLYHWQMMIWLAMFSSLTHLGTLSVLRKYLREHPAGRTKRIALMSAMAAMLVLSILPTGSPMWLHFPGEQARCYLYSLPTSWNAPGPSTLGNNAFLAIASIVILATGYLIRFIKLFERSSMHTRAHLRINPGRQLKKCLDFLLKAIELLGSKWSCWAIPMLYYPFLAGFLIVRAIFDVAESMLWEVCALAFIYALTALC